MVSETYSDSKFKETFRVKRETFFYILEKIEGSISKQSTSEEPISADKRLAICIYSTF